MIRKALVLAALSSGFIGGSALADDDWVGLYAGIHASDGSYDHMSIVPAGNGMFEFVITTHRLTFCGESPGWNQGTLAMSDGALVSQEETITCVDGTEAETPPGFRLTFVDGDDLILLGPQSGDLVGIYFHRISAD
ncbi:MAG: hypothetical protein AAF414_00590 [Pseudomonadota bacterium]